MALPSDSSERRTGAIPSQSGVPNYTVALLSRDRNQRNHIQRELEAIRENYGVDGAAVLDIGCGLGDSLSVFRPNNTTEGIEGLPEAVEIARASGLRVSHGNLEEPLAIPTGSQDWVLCLDVLEHLVSPLALMFEIKRVLRMSGRAVVNVPNHLTLKGRIRLLMGSGMDVHKFFPESDDWNNPHLRFFTHEGFRRMLQIAGFRVIDDRSWKFPDIELALAPTVARRAMQLLAKRFPALFAGGYFLVLEREDWSSVRSER